MPPQLHSKLPSGAKLVPSDQFDQYKVQPTVDEFDQYKVPAAKPDIFDAVAAKQKTSANKGDIFDQVAVQQDPYAKYGGATTDPYAKYGGSISGAPIKLDPGPSNGSRLSVDDF